MLPLDSYMDLWQYELTKPHTNRRRPIMTLRLWIKGPTPEALISIQARGIGELSTPVMDNKGTAVVDVPKADLAKIAAWFCETSEAPFPQGTLLYYAYSPNGKS